MRKRSYIGHQLATFTSIRGVISNHSRRSFHTVPSRSLSPSTRISRRHLTWQGCPSIQTMEGSCRRRPPLAQNVWSTYRAEMHEMRLGFTSVGTKATAEGVEPGCTGSHDGWLRARRPRPCAYRLTRGRTTGSIGDDICFGHQGTSIGQPSQVLYGACAAKS